MNFEAEMSRFEAEIRRAAGQQQPIFQQQQQQVPQLDAMIQAQVHARAGLPPPMHHQPPSMQSHIHTSAPPSRPPPGGASSSSTVQLSAPPKTILSAKRQLEALKREEEKEEEEDIMERLMRVEQEVKKEKKMEKEMKKGGFVPSSVTQSSAGASSAAAAAPSTSAGLSASTAPLARAGVPPPVASISDDTLKKGKKMKRNIRTGGGQIWEDESLKEWDPADFRLFCGDLGNDVTDEVLARTFGRYASFQRAKVVRCKKTNKTRGYGFVSFREPADFTRAMKEINGKYVGSRPIKLRKSNWKDRNIDVVRSKQKIKQQMGYKW